MTTTGKNLRYRLFPYDLERSKRSLRSPKLTGQNITSRKMSVSAILRRSPGSTSLSDYGRYRAIRRCRRSRGVPPVIHPTRSQSSQFGVGFEVHPCGETESLSHSCELSSDPRPSALIRGKKGFSDQCQSVFISGKIFKSLFNFQRSFALPLKANVTMTHV